MNNKFTASNNTFYINLNFMNNIFTASNNTFYINLNFMNTIFTASNILIILLRDGRDIKNHILELFYNFLFFTLNQYFFIPSLPKIF